jgi:glycosyl-4,4'-diaponeurosporenoate acyltransferase
VLIELSIGATTALNFAAWLVIQLGLAWGVTQLSATRFNPGGQFARIRGWERSGRFYERWFRIKAWKDNLPDGGRWLSGGFSKARLRSRDRKQLELFARETWRGEFVHWLALGCLPLFGLWNPWWGVLVNAVVALGLNLPCILAQRYNRARLNRALGANSKRWPPNLR